MHVSREYKGPAARLVDLQNDRGQHFVGIVFYEKYHNHTALTSSLEGLIELLKYPVANGITPLHLHSGAEGAFVYETGKCKSIAELIRQVSDLGLKPGPRAGLELMLQVAIILKGAVKIAEEYAICSHGGLSPWRIMIRNDGKVQVIGFAVPQVEILDFRDDPKQIPREDSFRYSPPERMLRNEEEDISSDLFSLALIGFELSTTKPMYDGRVSAIQESAQRADVSLRLNQALQEGRLDRGTHDFLSTALRLERTDRFFSPEQFISEAKRLLSNPNLEGMSLFEVMGHTQHVASKRSKAVEAIDDATGIMTIEQAQKEDNRSLIASITSQGTDQNYTPPTKISPPEEVRTAPNPPSAPKELLKMLQESRASIPTEAPPKVDVQKSERVSKRAKANANLLAQLQQSSIQEPNAVMPVKQPPIRKKDSEPEQAKRKKREDLLQSLLNPVSRASRDHVAPVSTAKAPQTVEDQVDESATAIIRRPDSPAPSKPKEKPSKKGSAKSNRASTEVASQPPERKKKPQKSSTKSTKKDVSVPSTLSVDSIYGAPQPYRCSLPAGKTASYHISLGEGMGTIKQSVSSEVTVSDLINLLLVNRVLPVRMDLSGRITSHYRLLHNGEPCSGRFKMKSLGSKRLLLCSVPNEIRVLSFEIQTDDEIYRFVSPVGLSVPVGSLIDHMISWLRLGRGKWVLMLGDDRLHPHDVLHDVQDALQEGSLRLIKEIGSR